MGFRNFVAAMAAACLAGSPVAAAAEAAPRPGLWRLADEDTTIYLFGTIHLLPAGTQWRSTVLERAIDSADELVLEADFSNPATDMQTMQRLAMSPNLPPLLERVPEDKRAGLQRAVELSGIPLFILNAMEDWAAALVLITASIQRLGYQQSNGIEEQLRVDYIEAGKPISGLNTVEEQFGFFDGLSKEAQSALLVAAADDFEEAREQLDEMLAAWSSGDSEAIELSFDDETNMSEELREVLMRGRNRLWTRLLAERLERPGTVFVAVGAGHLAGDDSVQAMLAARGLRAERIQ